MPLTNESRRELETRAAWRTRSELDTLDEFLVTAYRLNPWRVKPHVDTTSGGPERASNEVERTQLTEPPRLAGDAVRIAPRRPLSGSREANPPGPDKSTDHLYGTHFPGAGLDAGIALGHGLVGGSAGRLGGRDKAGGLV